MPDGFTPELPVFSDIMSAVNRLAGRIVRTPLLESPLLNQRMGRRILVKPECLQRTGSFKFRGASNKILALGDSVKTGGVVAYSSGNHAQGVAAAAHFAGIPALIVMPSDAPAIKRANTAAWGAEIKLYDRFTENREALAQSIAKSRGAAIVPPYDDPLVIAGQGTVGVEIAEQLEAMDVKPCAVVVPCGGGGLISGTALALSNLCPDVPIYSAEPADFNDTARSLTSGERESVSPDARSICDALLTPTPGVITFALNQALLSGGLSVTDKEALAAMRTAFLDLKLVVEPGGAVALASILSGKLPPGDDPVVAVLSGGNVDPETFQAALQI
ncbi:MAG: pyridoxal-5'-phosphate-dependent protein [Rhodospirillaceae bacterium]|nr:pyridoxal-5'-phosphate-dependent protein [Rhodospirillaceae bacterium]MAX61215.1 pyridoxal-5'-phosphate-dependent protein [Rhodospirillaceae bacterium]MBB55958.1 pyridoxal-5'-phosphate-dependent protein [Rhodospirillaceae bacterium]|tara:strand:+ start:67637 stop:68629 length:993 start_codon:yes stop_codon:yes gene_type:complete